MAIRIAVGASRRAIVRQLLVESLLLAIAGGVAGAFVGAIGLRALLALAPAELPRLAVPSGLNPFVLMDGRVVLFTFAVSILTGLLFGLAPALQISRPDVNAALREGGRALPPAALSTAREAPLS